MKHAAHSADPSGRGSQATDPGDGDGPLGLQATLWRGVDVFRIASLLYAWVLFGLRAQDYLYPWWAALVLLAMTGWTGAVALRPDRPPRLIVADLMFACAAILLTRLVDDPARILSGAQTLPVTWPAAAVLSWAVWRGWRGGLFAGACVALAGVLEVWGGFSVTTAHNVVLLLLLGSIVGYCSDLFRQGRVALAAALQVQAATAERDRLARDIHDGVLQVLAFVQRRGRELGGEAADLGRMAGEQEVQLRALVTAAPPASGGHLTRAAKAGRSVAAETDLIGLLTVMGGADVHVSTPAEPVLLPAAMATEVAAAVTAALDNVVRHAGPGAQAWVLVENEAHQVTVSVRDDGAGIPPGRIDAARREGRLGVSSSVLGRIEELGGSVDIDSGPGRGTEIELRVPRPTTPGRARG